ncbi:MAG: hypothetical protein P8Y96_01480 [Desulfuromonadales bacterium]
MNRKRVILAILCAILAVSVTYAYLATPRLAKAPPRAAGTGSVKAAAPSADGARTPVARERVDFSFLKLEPQAFPGVVRNIFRFGQTAPVRPQVATPVRRPAPVPVVPKAVAPVPMKVVQKSLSRFTFLGFLDKGGEKTVFLASGGELYLAGEGERFGVDKEFLVKKIDQTTLQVEHRGQNQPIEIPLIEQQKLSASVSAPKRSPRPEVRVEETANGSFSRPQPRRIPFSAPRSPSEPPQEENAAGNPADLTSGGMNPETVSPGAYDSQAGAIPGAPAGSGVREGDFNGTNQ